MVPYPSNTEGSSFLRRDHYRASVQDFLQDSPQRILGQLTQASGFAVELSQRDAWLSEVEILQSALQGHDGYLLLEYSIPRMGRRVDAVVLMGGEVLVIEFKVGESQFPRHAIDQIEDYTLDLRNFHEPSQNMRLTPVLVCTRAQSRSDFQLDSSEPHPVLCNAESLASLIDEISARSQPGGMAGEEWAAGRYSPTPTIVEAALALYGGHSVKDISRSDAGAVNLASTSKHIDLIIERCREKSEKAIIFVTGVPGAGKTLVGLDVATRHLDRDSELYSVFLSGNGPLVSVLHEALARDRVARDRAQGIRTTKQAATSQVKTFVQNVHHFRDDCLRDPKPPIEHVALFDEAQRAWDRQQTANFMRRKKGVADFDVSESAFLISCLDRHDDWAVVVCLVGQGQEINTGEAGVSLWIEAIQEDFPEWKVYASKHLTTLDYAAGALLDQFPEGQFTEIDELHLSVSMRSFRSERVSEFVQHLLAVDLDRARTLYADLAPSYGIVLTRDLERGKQWVRERARGTERIGLLASSSAERLRALGIHIKAPMNPVHWFLNERDDVRSSYYLEDVATEFHIQGLEIDWACVTWDADLRYSRGGWLHRRFVGNSWNKVNKAEAQRYLVNAYRVLLTRARQGMVIVIPDGAADDPTREPIFYNETYQFLLDIGVRSID